MMFSQNHFVVVIDHREARIYRVVFGDVGVVPVDDFVCPTSRVDDQELAGHIALSNLSS